MTLRKLSLITLVLTLMGGLAAAPPATSAPPSTVTAKAKATGEVTGTVTFQGEPVEDALVWWKAKGGYKSATTDRQGRFTFKAAVGKHKISAFSEELSTLETYVGGALRDQDAKKVKVRKGRTTKVKIELAPAATITGRVVDSDGQPLAEIAIEARNLDRHAWMRRVETDQDGRYTVSHLPWGKIEIKATSYSSRGHRVDEGIVVRAKDGRTVSAPDITLEPHALGVITAEIAGPTGPGAFTPEAISAHHDSVELEQDTASGLWSAEVPVGTWHVTAFNSNVQTTNVRVGDGATTHAGRLTLPTARSKVKGTVLLAGGKRATAGEVWLKPELGTGFSTARISKNGTFTAKDAAPGTYVAHAIVYDRDSDTRQTHPVRVKVKAGKTTTTTLKLKRQHTVRGKVVYRGKPVRGMELYLSPINGYAKTDAQGKFTIRRVPRGKYTLEVRDKSPTYRFKDISLTVRGDVKGLRIKLKK